MPPLERVIVTGSTGFVGRALGARIARSFEPLHFGAPDWMPQLQAADFAGASVFHLAARVHRGAGTEDDYIRDNRDKTIALATAAARGGAKRLVFLSTVKVNGEESHGSPFRAGDTPRPEDAYGRSKWEAEKALARIGSTSGLEYAIVRSPLVYGPLVRGNLGALLRLADSPLPLPFAAVANRRSFVHVDDLARLLLDCARLPQAAGGTFLAAHPQPVSTAVLVAGLRRALGRPPRLFRMPPHVLAALAAATGQGSAMRRLTGSLEVDAEDTRRELQWSARVSFQTAVEDMVHSYRSDRPA